MSELRVPLQRFLSERKSPLAAHFSDMAWITKQAYLCDIISLLNELHLSLQGKMTAVGRHSSSIPSQTVVVVTACEQGHFWTRCHTLVGILGETVPLFSQLEHDHLFLLLKEFERCFPTTKDQRTGKEWICGSQRSSLLLHLAADNGHMQTMSELSIVCD